MGQESSEVAITYEFLYELLRREKNRDELQALDAEFFSKLLSYLREKEGIFHETAHKSDLFSASEKEKLQVQLQNIKKIVKDLYEKREKKIIDMALNKSKIGGELIDTTPLLKQEKTLFDNLVITLNLFRNGILSNVLNLREPENYLADIETPEEQIPSQAVEKKVQHVKFLKEVQEFVGTELETYGPFKQEDTAYLPREIAELVISQGNAVEAEEE